MTKISKKMEKEFLKSFDKNNDAIFRFLLFRVYDRELAKDLTQDTFAKAWQYISDGNNVENIKTFLYTIARNLVIDYSRKKKSLSLEKLMEKGFAPHIDEKEKLNMAIYLEKIIEAIASVPKKYAEVLHLRFIDDLGPKEISHILKESQNVVSVRINRGVKELKEVLKI
jgi:RNA polymerase sigma-70 factor, ECF subfamily